MKKSLLNLILAITLVMGMAAVLWATVPPPAANQYLGIYDSTNFSELTRADCLVCHVSDEVLVPRHHALINTKGYMCLDCHVLIVDGKGWVFDDFRTCNQCHKKSPHHVSAKAAAQDCQGCHGDWIDNPLDNHYMPTYPVSSVTPGPIGRSVTATDGSIAIVQGCAACHQPDATAIDPITNVTHAINSNKENHHGTGIGQPGGTVGACTWCHDTNSDNAIRRCEACHGVKSLHNIQRKSPTATTVVPGSEALGYGHVGNNWDCVGCHWSWYGNASTNPATAIIPAIKGQSAYTLAAGKETALTITGVSFVNIGGNGVTYNPSVSISNATTSITLTPASVTDSEIQVLVPALQAGSYDLRVTKEGVKSNLAKLVVVPELAVKTAILSSKNTVTVTGTGFGAAPPADYNSGLGVNIGAVQCKVLSWSDTRVVASNAAVQVGAMVTVKTLNGSISKPVSAAAAKTR